MALILPIEISIGNDPANLEQCPTILTNSTPYISWKLPTGILQQRYNIKMRCITTNATFISGAISSNSQGHQFPSGVGMNSSWFGVVHIEIIISEDPLTYRPFEYTSGELDDETNNCSHFFAYDPIAENIFNANNISLGWKSVFDLNFGQLLSYNVQLCENPLFLEWNGTDIIYDGMVDDSQQFYSTVSSLVKQETKYYWRVRAFDSLDYSDWSIVNAFKTVDNTPPTLIILNIVPLDNDYGDVMIEFSVNDSNHYFVSVVCEYSGGTQELNTFPCSLQNSLNRLTLGVHRVIWRSSRNEQKIEASDYQIHMRPHDGVNFGIEQISETFHLDNRRFGEPTSDFGSIEIEFPLSYKMVLYNESNFHYDTPMNQHITENPRYYNYYGWNTFDNLPLYDEFYYEADWNKIFDGDKHYAEYVADSDILPYRLPYPDNPNSMTLINGKSAIFSIYQHGRETMEEVQHYYHLGVNRYGTILPCPLERIPYRPHAIFGHKKYPYKVTGLWGTLQRVSFDKGSNIAFSQRYLKVGGTSYMYPTEDDGSAPLYTLDPELLGSNGYPIGVGKKEYEYAALHNQIYVKKYIEVKSFRTPDDIHGYKNWRVELQGDKYVRISIGHRGAVPTLNSSNDWCVNGTVVMAGGSLNDQEINDAIGVMTIGIPTYVPSEHALYHPVNGLSCANIDISSAIATTEKWQYVLGMHKEDWKWDGDIVWEWNDSQPKMGFYSEQEEPTFVSKYVKKTYTDFLETPIMPLISMLIADIGIRSHVSKYGLESEKHIDLDWIFESVFSPLYDYYYSGYSSDEHKGYENRVQPTFVGDRGICLNIELKDSQAIESLNIVYLQDLWDAYNTIHWTATLGIATKAHLQYTKYIDETTHGEWIDAITKNGSFDENFGIYLTANFTWDAFLDTINATTFENGCHYRFRLRLVDSYSGTYSQFVHSNKFLIDHNAINPANIVNTIYDPWNKTLEIEFRIDDTQGDLYDITALSFSNEGRTWNTTHIRDLKGRKIDLESNTQGDNSTIVTHKLKWHLSHYINSAGSNYRVRLFTTLSALREGVDIPVFKWTTWENPMVRLGQQGLDKLLGTSQVWFFDQEQNKWIYNVEQPVVSLGRIEKLNREISAIKEQPLPDGMFIYFQDGDETKSLIDPEGYNNWLQTDIGGLTRDILLQDMNQRLDAMQDEILINIRMKDEGEMLTRRNLIKQGFYNNGFIDNDVSKQEFRFRVEIGQYNVSGMAVEDGWEDRFNVYYRLQIDFTKSYDSQLNLFPLRDILFDGDNRLDSGTAGNLLDQTNLTYQHNLPKPPTVAEQNASHSIEGNDDFDDMDNPYVNNSNPNSYSSQSNGTYTLPKTELPGLRKEYYINPSYDSVNDVLPPTQTTWETKYHWRVASYNLIEGIVFETNRNEITNLEIYPDSNYIKIFIDIKAHQDLTNMNMKYIQVYSGGSYRWKITPGGQHSIETCEPFWETTNTLSFPTNRPRNPDGSLYDHKNYDSVWIPHTINRQRPCCIIDERHQYHLFYNKSNVYNQEIIMHAMGRNYKTFGEYAQCFPYYPIDNLNDFQNGVASSFYGSCIIKKNDEYIMWTTGNKNGVNKIYKTQSNKEFNEWSELEHCVGLNNRYYPSVIYKNDLYHLWCGGFDVNSKIYYYTSSDGINWLIQNGGNAVYEILAFDVTSPCIIEFEGVYYMFFTEHTISGTQISKVTSSDGIVWSDYSVEIDTNNAVYNPWVVEDIHKNNKELRIYYNETIDTKPVLKTANRTDRVWITNARSTYHSSSISGSRHVSATEQGNKYIYYLYLAINNLTEIDETTDVKIRLDFYNDYTKRDYMVQSEWIDKDNAEISEAELSPIDGFSYDEILTELTYGKSQ